MKPPKTLIIGAGPAGLTAAYHLSKHGAPVTVLESDPDTVGGISRTAYYAGNRFDVGGHRFFTKNQEIWDLWLELLGSADFHHVERLSRIYYQGKFYNYPLKPLQAFRNLGVGRTAKILASYAHARLRPIPHEKSFADWVTNRFGKELFETFFKSYTEKVWGMKTSELGADWAAQRIQGLSLVRAVMESVRPGKTAAATLTTQFHYPTHGPGQMWEKTRDRIVELGGTVVMNAPVTQLMHRSGKVTSLQAGKATYPVDGQVLSTMPLRSLIESLHPKPPADVRAAAAALRYRDFLTVVLVVEQEHLFADQWLYIHDPTVKVGRIQNYRNWSLDLVADSSTTTLGLEYFCSIGDPLWESPDQELIELGKREVRQLGLVGAAPIREATVLRMPKAYPVYDEAYKERVATIRSWLETFTLNLIPIGRNGMHKYNNQDHSMLTGLLAAKNILGQGNFDVWKVHTDAHYDEEEEQDTAAGRAAPKHPLH